MPRYRVKDPIPWELEILPARFFFVRVFEMTHRSHAGAVIIRATTEAKVHQIRKDGFRVWRGSQADIMMNKLARHGLVERLD